MDALLSKANSIRSPSVHRKHVKGKQKPSAPNPSQAGPSKSTPKDETVASLVTHTELPPSLKSSIPLSHRVILHPQIKNKRLRLELDRQSAKAVRAQDALAEAFLVTEAVGADAGRIQLDGETERTWRIGQSEIANEVGIEAGRQRKEWRLEDGPYRCGYTRNGRYVF